MSKLVTKQLVAWAVAMFLTITVCVTQPAIAQDASQLENPLKSRSIGGVVVDQYGHPVGGADVDLHRFGPDAGQDPVRVTTDEQGRFSYTPIDPPGTEAESKYWQAAVRHESAGIALESIPYNTLADLYSQVGIVLQPSRGFAIKLLRPDGQPMPNADLEWTYINEPSGSYYELSESLIRQERKRTNAAGVVTWSNAPPMSKIVVTTKLDEFGIQFKTFDQSALAQPGPHVFQLKPVGSLTGKVTAPEPEATRNVEVILYGEGGRAETRTDENGAFEIPAMVAGSFRQALRVNRDYPYVHTQQRSFTLEAGGSAELSMQLKEAIVVRGSVLEEGTEKPIAGVSISSNAHVKVTDENGRYEIVCIPDDQMSVSMLRNVPSRFIQPNFRDRSQRVTPNPNGGPLELEPFHLRRAIEVQGRVLDENGQPAAFAAVRADWISRFGQAFTEVSSVTWSDENGNFTLSRIEPDVQVEIFAFTANAAMEAPLFTSSNQEEPLELRISPSGVTEISGTIVDQTGTPAPGALIKLASNRKMPDSAFPYALLDFPVAGFQRFPADEQGRFRTPVKIPRAHFAYVLQVEAPNMLKLEHKLGDEVTTADGSVELSPLVIYRVVQARGIVTDVAGNPIPGVKVWSYGPRNSNDIISAITAADGRFNLPGLHPQALFVFAEHGNYRMSGGMIPVSSGTSIAIKMDSLSGSPGERFPLRQPIGEASNEQLHRLLDPILPRLENQRGQYSFIEAAKSVAKLDRDWALELLPRITAESGRTLPLIELGELEDAFAAAMANEDPLQRSYRIVEVAEATNDLPTARRMLNEAFLSAQQVEAPDRRVAAAGNVAEAALDAGDRELAAKMVDSLAPLAEVLAKEGWNGAARGMYAETVCLFNTDAALELIKPLDNGPGGADDNRPYWRPVGKIAHELAGIQPELADELIRGIESDFEQQRYGVRVCYRMASLDKVRAIQLAESFRRDEAATESLGVIAVGLFEKDPREAKQILRLAYDTLVTVPKYTQNLFGQSVALSAYAEQIDPENSREYFWRGLAINQGPEYDTFPKSRRYDFEHAARLSLYLGLYDQFPEAQARLMEPIFQYWESYDGQNPGERALRTSNREDHFSAMAMCDMERTLVWHEKSHATLTDDQLRAIPQGWQSIGDVILMDGQELARHLATEVFWMWKIDEED